MEDSPRKRFDHPLASKVSWRANGPSWDHYSHRFRRTKRGFEFRPSKRHLFVGLVVIFFGCIALVVSLGLAVSALNHATFVQLLFVEPFMLVFVLFGLVLMWQGRKMILALGERPAFDLESSTYSRRRLFGETTGTPVPFSRIRALQLLEKGWTDPADDVQCEELNLVLDNATRITVICLGGENNLSNASASIAEALGVPLWEAKAFEPQPGDAGPPEDVDWEAEYRASGGRK